LVKTSSEEVDVKDERVVTSTGGVVGAGGTSSTSDVNGTAAGVVPSLRDVGAVAVSSVEGVGVAAVCSLEHDDDDEDLEAAT